MTRTVTTTIGTKGEYHRRCMHTLHSVRPQKLPCRRILYHHLPHLHHPPHQQLLRIFCRRSCQPALNWQLAFQGSTVVVSFYNLICQLSRFTQHVHSRIRHSLRPPYDEDDNGFTSATTSQAMTTALPTTSMTMMALPVPAPARQPQLNQLHQHGGNNGRHGSPTTTTTTPR